MTQKASIRHSLIREIVRQRPISSQSELVEALAQRGMKATQATVSRDVRELGLRKYTGGYYAIAEDRHVRKMFQELVTSVVPAQNLVVVKTSTGIAQGVAAALDASKRGEVIGTIAGDDTIILVCEDNDRATEVARLLDAYRT